MDKHNSQKVHEALSLLNEAAKDQKDDLRSMLADKYDDLRGILLSVQSGVSDQARHGMKRLQELRHAAAHQVVNTSHRVDQKAHDDPWKMMGAATVGAFALGFLVGRKA